MFGLIIKSAVRREARAVPTWLRPVRVDICAHGRMERPREAKRQGAERQDLLVPHL